MKRWIKQLPLWLLIVCVLAGMPVTASAAPKAIQKSDYVITLNKKKFDYLQDDLAKLSELTDTKVTKLKTVSRACYELKAKKAGTFYGYTSSGYVAYSTLSSGVATARGIKVGSTEKKLLGAYPTPTRKWTDKGVTTYVYQAPIPKNEKFKSLTKARPLSYYGLVFMVNDKTGKVTEIRIDCQIDD